jgi:hypothetical protein
VQLTVSTSAPQGEACAQPGILILKVAKPEACAPRGGLVIDAHDIARLGAQALTIENGQVRRETVADARGARPWSTRAPGGRGE